ncbi:uncharacterized protein LOC129106160 isoform X2 [Anoplopoma fimbria]|uniref:uncharacterized protein LOC129106160 isoform X2 n=1 Tax=Anoplopoma fimbria TaxID=229290 RepID=UPI0023EC01E2|nr:uncharacterized protein LOC129106160 isoform X2 [Anoplopoma fimbria]
MRSFLLLILPLMAELSGSSSKKLKVPTLGSASDETSEDTSTSVSSEEMEESVPPNTSTPSVTPSTSRQPVTTSSVASTTFTKRDGGSRLTIIIPVVVSVALLVLLLILVLGYKRSQRSSNTRNRDQNNEDRAYEEIQERPQKPGSGTALKTIYVTANAPTILSAWQDYSTANFPNGSAEAAGDTYSTVEEDGRVPAYSTVNHPSRLPEDPFYSTVNNPQQL